MRAHGAEWRHWGHGVEALQRMPEHSRAAPSLSNNFRECGGMERDGYGPVLLNTNTSRFSSASCLRNSFSTSWLRPRPGRAHQARAAQLRPRRRPCTPCGCSPAATALSSCHSRQMPTLTQRTGWRVWWWTLLVTRETKASAQTPSSRLRAVGRAAVTRRNGP